MKITIESTEQIVEFSTQRGQKPYRARVWVGETDSGIPIHCLIPRIAVKDQDNLQQFEMELKKTNAPEPTEQVFPMRMIL